MGEKEITIRDVYLLMQQINSNLSEKIEKVEQSTQSLCKTLKSEVATNKEEVQLLQEENKQLKTQLEKVERRQRHNNLVFYGIEEEATETQYFLIETIVEITRQKLEVELKESEINDIFRLGKKTGHKRPVLISLLSHIKRQEILKNGPKLKNTGIFIAEDLSESDLKERKILIGGLKEARNNNKKASIKGNKLIVDGEVYTAGDISHPDQITSGDYFSPPQRKIASEPPTPSPKEIEEEELNAVFPTLTKRDSKKEEGIPPSTSNQGKPQEEKKKEEQKPKPKTSSISSSGETPKNQPDLVQDQPGSETQTI
ncbi:unnamed protein product [Phaedon cochleariae]|uniref:Endonuclease-reverse transcriptase n=1 Tax=Phaedon cochleariae TaxID=80249 RepID=A0A9N9X6W7_PHACE|nr:unnamed protein product [Phaedon cochleariae]